VTTPDLGRGEYFVACEILGLDPVVDPYPAARNAHVPPWYSPPLVATTPARAKLSAWSAKTPREAWSAPGDPAAVLATVRAFGDEVLAHTLARVIAGLPPPVCAYAVDRVTFFGVGLTMLGSASAPLPRDDRPWLVTYSHQDKGEGDDWTPDLMAHEVAHAFLLEEPTPGETVRSALWNATVMLSPMERIPGDVAGTVKRLRQTSDRYERECVALTSAWGFRPMGAAAPR
jgi:hypothetical protein